MKHFQVVCAELFTRSALVSSRKPARSGKLREAKNEVNL
jgi:hypothetical protein